jgi:hypothetical protein
MDPAVLDLLSKGGALGIVVVVLWRVVEKVTERIVKALDRMSEKFEKFVELSADQTKRHVEALGEVSERIARIEARTEWIEEANQVERRPFGLRPAAAKERG